MCVCLCVCVCTCFPGRKHLLQGVRGHLSDSVLQPLTDQPAELINCLHELKLQQEDLYGEKQLSY